MEGCALCRKQALAPKKVSQAKAMAATSLAQTAGWAVTYRVTTPQPTEPTYHAFPKWTPGLHETVRRILAAA